MHKKAFPDLYNPAYQNTCRSTKCFDAAGCAGTLQSSVFHKESPQLSKYMDIDGCVCMAFCRQENQAEACAYDKAKSIFLTG
jgi:hypothetical protein